MVPFALVCVFNIDTIECDKIDIVFILSTIYSTPHLICPTPLMVYWHHKTTQRHNARAITQRIRTVAVDLCKQPGRAYTCSARALANSAKVRDADLDECNTPPQRMGFCLRERARQHHTISSICRACTRYAVYFIADFPLRAAIYIYTNFCGNSRARWFV